MRQREGPKAAPLTARKHRERERERERERNRRERERDRAREAELCRDNSQAQVSSTATFSHDRASVAFTSASAPPSHDENASLKALRQEGSTWS